MAPQDLDNFSAPDPEDDETKGAPLPPSSEFAAIFEDEDSSAGSVEAPRPRRIGRYKILKVLGAGGMGVVYLAEQREPVRRRVALKLIKHGKDEREVIVRFESERQALALMNHPGIARVYDGGTAENGRPYFVMEHVRGEPITKYCDRHALSIRKRLDLVLAVCEAVQHAHQKGIIHRDIKPSNVLVTVENGRPVPKIIDFGVAKATDQRLSKRTVFTEQGQMIGTPEYMSPEQAEMSGLDIDTRTDIYSLGVLLYELLSGELPFDSTELREAGYAGMQRMIREVEPPSPSTRLSLTGEEPIANARRRATNPRLLIASLRGDLDWITMKAMEKDRSRRYESAAELAQDIRRHLDDEAVLAGPPSRLYRLKKLALKNRGLLAAVATVLLTLLGGMVVSLMFYFEASSNFHLAQEKEAAARAAGLEAQKKTAEAEANFTIAEEKRLEASRAHERTKRALAAAERHSYVANITAAVLHQEATNLVEARRRLKACPPHLRRWEWNHLDLKCDSSLAIFRLGARADEFVPTLDKLSPGGEAVPGFDIKPLKAGNHPITLRLDYADGSRQRRKKTLAAEPELLPVRKSFERIELNLRLDLLLLPTQFLFRVRLGLAANLKLDITRPLGHLLVHLEADFLHPFRELDFHLLAQLLLDVQQPVLNLLLRLELNLRFFRI